MSSNPKNLGYHASMILYITLAILLGQSITLGLQEQTQSNHKSIQNSKSQVHNEESNIIFTLFATDMSGCDSNSDCDLFVVIHGTSSNEDRNWKQCGKTSKMQDANFPVWPEVFTFPATLQGWKFELFDADVVSDDLIGIMEVDVNKYANATGNLYQISVPGNTGTLWIHRQR